MARDILITERRTSDSPSPCPCDIRLANGKEYGQRLRADDRTRNGIGLRALGDRGLLGGYGGCCQRGVALGDVLAYLRVVIGLLRQQSVKRDRGRNAPVESALLELVRDTHADNGRAVGCIPFSSTPSNASLTSI